MVGMRQVVLVEAQSIEKMFEMQENRKQQPQAQTDLLAADE